MYCAVQYEKTNLCQLICHLLCAALLQRCVHKLGFTNTLTSLRLWEHFFSNLLTGLRPRPQSRPVRPRPRPLPRPLPLEAGRIWSLGANPVSEPISGSADLSLTSGLWVIGSGFAVHGAHQLTQRSNELVCKLWTSVSSNAQWNIMLFPEVVDIQLCYVMSSGLIFARYEVSHFGEPVGEPTTRMASKPCFVFVFVFGQGGDTASSKTSGQWYKACTC